MFSQAHQAQNLIREIQLQKNKEHIQTLSQRLFKRISLETLKDSQYILESSSKETILKTKLLQMVLCHKTSEVTFHVHNGYPQKVPLNHIIDHQGTFKLFLKAYNLK